jgi:hypothetical protein
MKAEGYLYAYITNYNELYERRVLNRESFSGDEEEA